MKWFDYSAPQSLAEAIGLLSAHSRALPMAGGTDLLVQLRAGTKETDLVVDVKRIPELNEIRHDFGSGLSLGAAVPCFKIAADPCVRRLYPALAGVASLIGGTQIQSRASLGGNLCNAAPSADFAPILIALRAVCRITGPDGAREVAVEDFFTAPGRSALQPGEMLVSCHVPAQSPGSGAHYMRFTPRNEMDIAVAGAGVAVTMDGGTVRSARIALSAVAPTPLFVREAGEWLEGREADDANIRSAAEMACAAARPITDMRGTTEHRRHLCAVLTRGALAAAVQMAKEAQL